MSKSDKKRQSILDAAVSQFSQYGYRKTSMEDIAREAGISRPSLYSYFENKEEIFRSLSQALNEQALENARNALEQGRGNLSIGRRVEAALLAFNVSLFRRLDESPHGAELLDESNRLCGDVATTFYASFQALLAREIGFACEGGELNLAHAGVSAEEAAEVIRFSVVGLKAGAGDADNYQRRVEQFIRVYFGGLG